MRNLGKKISKGSWPYIGWGFSIEGGLKPFAHYRFIFKGLNQRKFHVICLYGRIPRLLKRKLYKNFFQLCFPYVKEKICFIFENPLIFFYIPCKSLQIVKKVQIVKCIRNLINHRYLLFENFFFLSSEFSELFHDGGPYHIETSPLICRANHWTGFYMRRTSIMKNWKPGFYAARYFEIFDEFCH